MRAERNGVTGSGNAARLLVRGIQAEVEERREVSELGLGIAIRRGDLVFGGDDEQIHPPHSCNGELLE